MSEQCEPLRRRSELISLLALLALCGPLFFHRLAARDLWSSHEARAGMDAQSLLDDESWGLPHLYDGQPELQKPPLYYWLTASLGWMRGGTVDAWAVRLPAALAALACALALALGMARGRRRGASGMFAAVVLATSLHFTWLARIGRIDMPLTMCLTLALGGAYLSRSSEGWRRLSLLLLAYLAVSAGVLFKGPIAVALPGAVLLTFLLAEHGLPTPRRWRAWFEAINRLGVWWGLPLVLALTLPWFVWANRTTDGAFFRVFVWHHNFERGLGGSSLRSNPWWFYGPQFLSDFLPWSLVLPPTLWWFFRRRLWRIDADVRFGLCWFGSVVLFLSCSRFKRADYLLPAYPGMALFLGCVLHDWLRIQSDKVKRCGLAGFGIVTAGMVVAWLIHVEWTLPARESYRDYRAFAARVRDVETESNEIIFFRTEAHPLAFHLGRPLTIVVQWQELKARLQRPGTHYVVTPPRFAEELPFQLRGLAVENVLRNTDLSGGAHEHPLVFLRANGLDWTGKRP